MFRAWRFVAAVGVASFLAATSRAADPPIIVSTVPALGATNVSRTAPFIATFNTAMNTTATLIQFLDTGSTPPVILSTTASWSADGRQMTNTPASPFAANTRIGWIVVAGRDTLGNALLGQASGFFVTSSGGGGAAPTLVATVPSNLASNVAPGAPVIFTFSAAMNTNATTAQFLDPTAPMSPLPVIVTWSADKTTLTNTPSPPFPAGKLIFWNLAGEDLSGSALAKTNGLFLTAASAGGQTNLASIGLVSRGETAEQADTNLFQDVALEFVALASANPGNDCAVTAPAPGRTNTLANGGAADALEFADRDANSLSFGTNYPAGTYTFTLATTGGVATASLDLGDSSLPSAPRVANWQSSPHAVLGQPWSLQWDSAAGGATVDYVRVSIEQDGTIVFATPLPGAAGALTGASNSVVVPAGVFTNVGRSEVSLTAFSFTGLDTNSIPGTTFRAARHRTTTFELRAVDGSVPPPVLLTTNMGGVAVGEPFLNPLFTTNGVRPLRFELLSGTLPPGLALEPGGALAGQATNEGTFDATLRLTDLLDRSSTQSLRVVTVPLPPTRVPPRIENVGLGDRASVVFDLVGAAGTNCVIERSTNLSNWASFLTTNVASDRLTLHVPIDRTAAFFRVRGPGLPFLSPHPLTVTPVLNTNANATASAQLDELGGTLSLTNGAGYVFVLNVPVGALDRTETITMTDVAQMGGLPLDGGLRAAVELRPEGLPFNVPARLDITSPTDLDATTIIGFGARPDGSQFALQPAFNTNRTVSLHLWHFSTAGAGNSSAANAQGQAQNSPDDPMAALAQQVAATLQACRADPSCANDPSAKTRELTDLYIQMADQVVLPKLQQAVGDDAVLDDALRTWLQWLRDMALLGLYSDSSFGNDQSGELPKRVRRASNLAAQALRNGITKSCDRCLQHEVWRIYRMLELTRWASLLGMDYDELFWSCARKCLVFELHVESEFVSSNGGYIYSTHTKGKAKLRPPDPATADLVRLMLIFSGSGSWDITDLQHTVPARCSIVAAPAAGRLEFPWVKIDLYKKREVYVPGQGPVTSYVFDPDMTVRMRAGLSGMPKEQRTLICPPDWPVPMGDIFAPSFNWFHNDEVEVPTGVGADVLGGPVFRMTGFVPGGPADVILSKPYLRTLGTLTENTLIELRHTPE